MSDFLEQLGRAAREEERLGERIDEAGEAVLSGGSPDPALGLDAEALREAYRPLSAEAKAAIVARVAGVVARSTVPSETTLPVSSELPSEVGADLASTARSEVGAPERAETSPQPAALIRPRAARARWAIGIVPALAAAAALVLWLNVERPVTPAAAALAAYQLEVQGSVAAERSAPSSERAGPLAFATGTPVRLLLRPDHANAQAVTAHAYFRALTGLTALEHSVEAAPGGALRMTIAADTPWPERGVLVVWMGAADAEPEPAQLSAKAAAAGPGWQRIEREFVRAP